MQVSYYIYKYISMLHENLNLLLDIEKIALIPTYVVTKYFKKDQTTFQNSIK